MNMFVSTGYGVDRIPKEKGAVKPPLWNTSHKFYDQTSS